MAILVVAVHDTEFLMTRLQVGVKSCEAKEHKYARDYSVVHRIARNNLKTVRSSLDNTYLKRRLPAVYKGEGRPYVADHLL